MRFFKTGLMLLSVVVLLSSCATTDKAKNKKKTRITPEEYLETQKPDLSKFSPSQATEAKKFAILHADNFYKGLKNKNHALFSKTRNLSKKDFNHFCKIVDEKYGKLESQSYVGVKAEPFTMQYMWKWSFKKKIMNQTFNRDLLFNVFIIKYKNKKNYSLYLMGFK